MFSKTSRGNWEKRTSLLHLIQFGLRAELFNCCYYYFFSPGSFSSCPTPPSKLRHKAETRAGFHSSGRAPQHRVIDRSSENPDSCRNCAVEAQFPGVGNNILMVLILFGIVKIRKGYRAEEGTCLFFLRTKAYLVSSLVSLGCHFQPSETVSDYPCGN